ncbi:MAG: hypothetical protein ACOX0A_08820 [Thermoguttaceae bacterium]
MKSKLFILLVLVVFLSTSVSVGCRRMTYPRDELQVVCRDTDAIVLRSSAFDSKGKIYYVKKNGSRWELAQTIDISRYLRMREIPRLYWSDIYVNRLAIKTFAYDDQWLGVVLNRRDKQIEDISLGMPGVKFAYLLFKKVDGQWTFYNLFTPWSMKYSRDHIEISHDSLIVEGSNKKYRAVCCFDLTGRKPVLKQEIRGPYDANIKSAPNVVLTHGSQMIISWSRPIPKEDLAEMEEPIYWKSTSDLALYRWDGEKWAFEQNLSDSIPRELYLKEKGGVLDLLVDVDWTEDYLYCYESNQGGVCKFKKLESGDWIFDGRFYENYRTDEITCRGQVGYQVPERYNVYGAIR